MNALFKAGWTSEDSCLKTIHNTYRETGYLLDTHTAVAKDVAERFVNQNRPMIIAATAHYSKFPSDVLRGLGHSTTSHDSQAELLKSLRKLNAYPHMHGHIETTVQKPQIHNTVCDASLTAIMGQIEKVFA